MREIPLDEFVRRMRRLLDRECLLAFFLGAGASISSGIPGAASLARRWAHELHETEVGDNEAFELWTKRLEPPFDDANPAVSYSALMRRLFPTQADRQREIESVVRGHDPGFAYATLAQLLAHSEYGKHCNIVMTTNFDDLVSDALYLYTRSRPLVVTHEALVTYAAMGRTRPTVIKLHGDAMLQPLNTEDELAVLAPGFVQALQNHLRSRGLILVGYGANDQGIFQALSSLGTDTIAHGIYWVNDHIPNNAFGHWLGSQPDAVWVNHRDFDQLMAVVKTEFELPNPDGQRFETLISRYQDTFADLQAHVQKTQTPDSVVARSVEQVRAEFGNWFSVELEAQKFKSDDPGRAEEIYERGIEEFPDSPELLSNFAVFLNKEQMDPDRAQEFFERAVAANPDHFLSLINFATFLIMTRDDPDRAETLFEHAIVIDPDNVRVMVLYANFAWHVRKANDRAEHLFTRALAASPDNVGALTSYATFLWRVRKAYDRAEQLLNRALDANPDNLAALLSYAIFLRVIRNAYDRAEEYHNDAIKLETNAEASLGAYAVFLEKARKDYEKAGEVYEQAIAADPYNANNLCNYVGFLFGGGMVEKAHQLVTELQSIPQFMSSVNGELRLEVWFYRLANDHVDEDERRALLIAIREALLDEVRSDGWNFARNIAQAERAGLEAPELEFLRTLADVIAGREPLRRLDEISEWQQLDET